MRDHDTDSGFTLVEVMVTIALAGLIMAFAVSGWSQWAAAGAHSGAARELQSTLRQAQQQAVTQGTSICVDLDATNDTLTTYRGRCDDAARTKLVGPLDFGNDKVFLSGPAFTPTAAGTSTGVTFSSRGTAWPGRVEVRRTGSDTVHTITVEGLTGRVSLS